MDAYFDDGQVVLYHGDCREVLPLLGDSVDLIVTDPPYGVGWQSNRRTNQLAAIEGDDATASDLVREALAGSLRLLRDMRHLYVFGRPDLPSRVVLPVPPGTAVRVDEDQPSACPGMGAELVHGRCSTCGAEIGIDDAGMALRHPSGVTFSGPDAAQQAVDWLTEDDEPPTPAREATTLTREQIAGAAEGIDMAQHIVAVHIPTPDDTDDARLKREQVRRFLAPYINDVLIDSVTDGVIELAPVPSYRLPSGDQIHLRITDALEPFLEDTAEAAATATRAVQELLPEETS